MPNLKTEIESSFKYFKTRPSLNETASEYVVEGHLYCCVEGYSDLYDTFHVIIKVPFDFPHKLPVVIELDNKIERSVDYHMDSNGKCCLGTQVAIFDYMQTKKISSFSQFLEQIIIIHFFQIKYFMVKREWLQTPEAHYTEGVRDSYKRIFKLNDEALYKIASRKFRRFDQCLCGNSRRFDKCHGKYIPFEQIQLDLQNILNFYKENKIFSSPGKVSSRLY
jgi:hypothetical protein